MAAQPILVERVLVAGSRDWTDRPRLERELLHELMLSAHNNRIMLRVAGAEAYLTHTAALSCVHFILGDCPDGADFIARKWCEEHAVSHEIHRVRDGRQYTERFAAEVTHARNQMMVTHGRPDRYVAFWDGRREPSGTCDTMSRCTIAGVPGRTVPWNGRQPSLRLGSEPPSKK